MIYVDGNTSSIGDIVVTVDGRRGTVVCDIDHGQFDPSFPREEWAYLKEGIIVHFDEFGLIHYKESRIDGLRLERRLV